MKVNEFLINALDTLPLLQYVHCRLQFTITPPIMSLTFALNLQQPHYGTLNAHFKG